MTNAVTSEQARTLLRQLFDAAVAAVDPLRVMPAYLHTYLSDPSKGRTIVIGAGKAAARMALAVEQHCTEHWPADQLDKLSGLVITRYQHGAPCQRVEVVEAGHPVPDEAGHQAAQRMLNLVQNLSPDDRVISLISGGGSALLTLPAPGLSLEEKRQINRALLASGAGIGAMNCVRRHLSAIKGGRLALACYPAPVLTLVLSDVPCDDPAIVASGPTLADTTTAQDALAILHKYRIPVSAAVASVLQNSSAPQPNDARLQNNRCVVIATAQQALDAAARVATAAGYNPLILGNSLEGEARDVALVHAAIARQIAQHGQPLPRPCVILSGGETTVTVRGQGRGGRNAEFLLALAIALDSQADTYAIACDTDGIDGTEDNAGCLLAPDSLVRARQHLHANGTPLDARACLANNDGYGFFATLGDLVVTGPTRTNVNDFRAILLT